MDVDALCDGENVFVSGIMEHIEEAGIHSGDSACSLPSRSLSKATLDELERQTAAMAKALNVGGLMNVQYAIKDDVIYVLEVNPRASRTVPFVAKTIGAPIAKIAARIMTGEKLDDAIAAYGAKPDPRNLKHIAVKEAVFPFARFPGVDTLLGPEMRSTVKSSASTPISLWPLPRASSAHPSNCRATVRSSSRSATRTRPASCRRS